jgi:hypothetical protein
MSIKPTQVAGQASDTRARNLVNLVIEEQRADMLVDLTWEAGISLSHRRGLNSRGSTFLVNMDHFTTPQHQKEDFRTFITRVNVKFGLERICL